MIKRLFIMFWFALSCVSTARACDACGCSTTGIGIGLMTDYRSNFFSVAYLETQFNSSPEHGHHNSSDVFARMNISMRYSFSKFPKLRFMVDLPYGYNRREDSGIESSIHGLSDAKIQVNYAFFNGMADNMKTSLYLEAGGGLKFQTGKYKEDITNENLPTNFNIGNGALGYILQLNGVLSHDKFGFLINNNYQLNTNTKGGYHFGNQYTGQLTVFREFPVSSFAIIPNLGLLYERIAIDKYDNGNHVPETGGEGLFFAFAMNFKTEKWLAGFSYSIPIGQHYSDGVVDVGRKIAAHISYLF